MMAWMPILNSLVLTATVGLLATCSTSAPPPVETLKNPPPLTDLNRVRVRILHALPAVTVSADSMQITAGSQGNGEQSGAARGVLTITPTPSGWRVGQSALVGNELRIESEQPIGVGARGHSLKRYRGSLVLVKTRSGVDVVNHLDVDSYLKGVIPKEIPGSFHFETFRAQAIVARTYALWEASRRGQGSHFDLYPDVRSQVYGGYDAETAKSRQAVDNTRGLVLAYGEPGRERIFKAYFSSTCGGVTQSNEDAFNEPLLPVFREQHVGTLCKAAPRYNWPAFELDKTTLTQRIRTWADRNGHAAQDMAKLQLLHVDKSNRFGRPVRFRAVDVNGNDYIFSGEQIRWAVFTNSTATTRLNSSFVTPVDRGDSVRFQNGRGWGHAVGMCQYCAAQRGKNGLKAEKIVESAYPGSVLVRGY